MALSLERNSQTLTPASRGNGSVRMTLQQSAAPDHREVAAGELSAGRQVDSGLIAVLNAIVELRISMTGALAARPPPRKSAVLPEIVPFTMLTWFADGDDGSLTKIPPMLDFG